MAKTFCSSTFQNQDKEYGHNLLHYGDVSVNLGQSYFQIWRGAL